MKRARNLCIRAFCAIFIGVVLGCSGSGGESDIEKNMPKLIVRHDGLRLYDGSEIYFGQVALGKTEIIRIILSNTGTAELNLKTDIVVNDEDSFLFNAQPHLKIAAGASETCLIECYSSGIGAGSAMLKIESDDPNNKIITILLKGEGIPIQDSTGSVGGVIEDLEEDIVEIEPKLIVDYNGNILSDGDEIDFGQVEFNETKTINITLRNVGKKTLTLENVSIVSDQGATCFKITEYPSSLMIAASESATYAITYIPSGDGTAYATLKIDSDDPVNKCIRLNLEGSEMVKPKLVIRQGYKTIANGGTLDFGQVVLDKTKTITITLQNDGTKTLWLTSMPNVNGVSSSCFKILLNNLMITAGSSEKMDITYIPSKIGSDSAILVINSDDPKHRSIYITLKGESSIKRYNLGDTGPGGGYVFYYNEKGFTVNGKECHYLECSRNEISKSITWCPCVFDTNYCSVWNTLKIGGGYECTQAILSTNHRGGALTSLNCAAKACAEYKTATTVAGEWYLPNIDELNEIYKVLVKDKNIIISTQEHWSSSQYNTVQWNAWSQNFGDGIQNKISKDNTRCVRAVRAF